MDSTINRILWARNTGVCSLSLLHRISPTQVLNPSLLHCRQFLYQLRHKRSKLINIRLDQISIPLLWNIWSVASYQFVLKSLTPTTRTLPTCRQHHPTPLIIIKILLMPLTEPDNPFLCHCFCYCLEWVYDMKCLPLEVP